MSNVGFSGSFAAMFYYPNTLSFLNQKNVQIQFQFRLTLALLESCILYHSCILKLLLAYRKSYALLRLIYADHLWTLTIHKLSTTRHGLISVFHMLQKDKRSE